MTTRLALLAAAVAAPLAAAAQTTLGAGTLTVTESSGQQSPPTVNIAECQGSSPDNLTFQLSFTSFTAGGSVRLQASTLASCPAESTTSTVRTRDVATNISLSSENVTYPGAGNGAVGVQSLLATLGVRCDDAATVWTAVYFCVTAVGTDPAVATSQLASASLVLDLLRPAPPDITGVSAGDRALSVSWSPGAATDGGSVGTASSYDLEARRRDRPDDVHRASVTSGTSGRVDGLENGVLYDVVVYASTAGGNRSDPSASAEGTPVEVADFWRAYRNAGGKDAGGCAAGAGGLAALAGLAPLALRRRRSR